MKPHERRHVDNVLPVMTGLVRNAFCEGPVWRHALARDIWYAAKRHGSRGIRNVDLDFVDGLDGVVVEGYIDPIDGSRQIIAALCSALSSGTFFEIGTFWGATTYTVARTNPTTDIYTLDLPSKEAAQQTVLDYTDSYLLAIWDSGKRLIGTPEGERVHRLFGDSAAFDFSPYYGEMDMVYIDGSHSYSYVKHDTEQALRMLTDQGTIIWDDYPGVPSIYEYLQKLSRQLDRPIYHIGRTRLALYSRHPAVPAAVAKNGT